MRYCPHCQRCFRDGVEFCLYDQTPTHAAEGLPLVIDGKYQLEGLIAHGGMGSVYRATHLQLERPVAIKILRAEFLADTTVRERFHREALAAARLKHPNIIAVYDFGSLANGCAYIVMELVEGRSLREELRLLAARHSQMRPERAMALLQQICAGVETAHRHGIIHRDLKPDNIMIETAPDGSERVLVLDFGIAKLKQPEGVVQCLTDEETVIGTPNYISPEQCTGLPVDARSDVYALGVILYEMLTAHVPFSNPSTSAVLLSHLQDPPLPPTRFCAGLSPAVERVVLRALAKAPQHRFASAAQLTEAMTAAVLRAGTEVISIVDWEEPVTRPRQPRVTLAQPAWVGETEEAEASFQPVAPRLGHNDSGEREVVSVAFDNTPTLPDREPTLLVERRPRRGLFVVVAGLSLVVIGALVDFNTRWLQGSLMRLVQSQSAGPTAAAKLNDSVIQTQSSPTPQSGTVAPDAMAANTTNERAAATAETPTGTPAPEALVKTSTAENKAEQVGMLQTQVKTFYRRWVQTALDTDWTEHAKFYADRVAYYNEGSQPRTQVVARKRRVLGGLDKYFLRFAGEPQITFTSNSNPPEAQLTFDKQWDLQRGQQRTAGKSLTQLVLRYEEQQWRIVGEKQLKLYHQSASVQKAKAVEQKSAAKKLQAAPQAKRIAQPILPQGKPGAAKPKKK
jgi:serine/threonine protein kinase